MFFIYLLLGSFAGAVSAFYLITQDATTPSTIVAFLIISQVIFWGGITFTMAYERLQRRYAGRVDDDDIVSEPGYILPNASTKDLSVRCLVVDDDEISLLIMKEMLMALGQNDVTICSSAQDALKIINESATAFDHLFLDIEMPNMGGVELCNIIRQQDAYRDTPIIMVTVKKGREDVKAAFGAGATDYITKPYSVDELESRLSAIRVAPNKRKSFDGVDRFISLTAMNNYLLQIERGGLFATNILTIKIDNYADLKTQTTQGELRNVLRDFARCTLTSLSDTDALVAYAGNGILACVTNTRKLDAHAVEHRISTQLFDTNRQTSTATRLVSGVSASTIQSISLEEREGESVFKLHCKIYDATEPRLHAKRYRRNTG